MNKPVESALAFQYAPPDRIETHEVLNQASPCAGHNAFTDDVALRELVVRHAAWSVPGATRLGPLAGDEATQDLARLANAHGVPSLAWTTAEPSGHFARAVLSDLWNQVESGTACPTGMACAACAGFAAGQISRSGARRRCRAATMAAACRCRRRPAR